MIEHVGKTRFHRLAWLVDPAATLARAWPLIGGISAEVTALELALPDGSQRRVVVRRHGPGDLADNPNIAADEFRLLTLLSSAGHAVPAPVCVDNAGDVLGTPCIVVEFMDGEPDFSPADPLNLVRQFAAHLVHIHTFDARRPDLAFLPDRAGAVAAILAQPPPTLDESLAEGQIRDVLAAVWPLSVPTRLSLLHGDYWPGNILCVGGQVSAIIDWEDAARGDPLADVANCRMEVAWTYGIEAMAEFTAHYVEQTTVDDANLPYWDLVAALRPAGKLSTWALDHDAEQRMRAVHRRFVEQAIAATA